MEIEVLAFGIAKDIIGSRQLLLAIPEHSTVADLRHTLQQKYPSFSKLASLKFAVEEEYVDDQTALNNRDQVVIIPPVSGG